MLTVLMATRNRARILRDVLESYCHLQAPDSGWKLIVVDNGTIDETPQVLASFRCRLPLHVLIEPKLGKNNALNAGLKLVEGDLTVFTDDDAFPCSDWLVQLRRAVDAQPNYTMFGGAVIPRWEVPPPPWIRWVELGPAFGMNSPSLKDGPLPAFALPEIIGPNMAIRSKVFESGTRFDSSIGPRGSSYPMGSETELVSRLGGQGHRGWHVHQAVVEHLVRAEQLKKAWVFQRALLFGRGRHRWGSDPESKTWIGVPRWLFRDIPREGMRLVAAGVFLRQEDFFRSRWRFNVLVGEAIEARKCSRNRVIGGRPVRSIS